MFNLDRTMVILWETLNPAAGWINELEEGFTPPADPADDADEAAEGPDAPAAGASEAAEEPAAPAAPGRDAADADEVAEEPDAPATDASEAAEESAPPADCADVAARDGRLKGGTRLQLTLDTLEQLVMLRHKSLPDRAGLPAEEYADALAHLIPLEMLIAVAKDAADVAYGSDEDTISLMVDWDSSDDEEREGDEPEAPEEVLGIQPFLPAQETDAPPKPATRARAAAGRTPPDDAPAVSPRDPTATAEVGRALPVYEVARHAGATEDGARDAAEWVWSGQWSYPQPGEDKDYEARPLEGASFDPSLDEDPYDDDGVPSFAW